MSIAGIRHRYRHGLIISAILARLRRIGLDLRPYVLYLEEPRGADPCEWDQVERITTDNLVAVLAYFPSFLDADKWHQRLARGDIGLALKDGKELVGYAWSSLSHFGGVSVRPLFDLELDEAYLFNLFVRADYRGRGLAVHLRRLMTRELVSLGRTKLYSCTMRFNSPARQLKRKLNATPIELRLAMTLFWSRSFDVRLRRYGDSKRAPTYATSKHTAHEFF